MSNSSGCRVVFLRDGVYHSLAQHSEFYKGALLFDLVIKRKYFRVSQINHLFSRGRQFILINPNQSNALKHTRQAHLTHKVFNKFMGKRNFDIRGKGFGSLWRKRESFGVPF